MMISAFTSQWRPLSNFSLHPATYDGVEYPTAEHAFAAAKTLDVGKRVAILAASGPARAKQMGRRVTLRPDWDSHIRMEAMEEIVWSKFVRPGEPRETLIATGDAVLVEGNTWHDNFWGVCHCGRLACAGGENYLGRCLMWVRRNMPEAT